MLRTKHRRRESNNSKMLRSCQRADIFGTWSASDVHLHEDGDAVTNHFHTCLWSLRALLQHPRQKLRHSWAMRRHYLWEFIYCKQNRRWVQHKHSKLSLGSIHLSLSSCLSLPHLHHAKSRQKDRRPHQQSERLLSFSESTSSRNHRKRPSWHGPRRKTLHRWRNKTQHQ